MTMDKEWCEQVAKLPLAKELIELLTPISQDPDFVYGTILLSRTKENRQKLIDEIKSKNINTYRDVCFISNEINFGRI